MENYNFEELKFLIMEYKNSTGIKKFNFDSDVFINELVKWFIYRKKMEKIYIDLLDYMEVDYCNTSCAEVGKTELDSLFMKNNSTTIISPFGNEIKKESNNKIITGQIDVSKNGKINLKSNKKNYKNIINQVTRFITQNPYTLYDINNWCKIYDKNITIGIFGNICDKDFQNKLDTMEKLKNNLQTDFIYESTIINDTYSSAISTNSKTFQKIKRHY